MFFLAASLEHRQVPAFDDFVCSPVFFTSEGEKTFTSKTNILKMEETGISDSTGEREIN